MSMLVRESHTSGEKGDVEMAEEKPNESVEDDEMEEGEASDDSGDVPVNVFKGEKPANSTNRTVDREMYKHHQTLQTYSYGQGNDFLYNADQLHSDVGFSSVDERTLVERAKRFGVETTLPKSAPTPQAIKQLYKSLGLDHSDFIDGPWQGDVVHVYTSESVDTENILQYFQNYAPLKVTWCGKHTCNVHFADSNRPIRALLGLSCPINYHDSASSRSPVPRPPTRRHNTPPSQAQMTTEDSIKQAKILAKKLKKTKKAGIESENNSDDSDSSSESSSSDSSSDSESSSDSDSSDSSSNSSNSSSSSDSDSDDSDTSSSTKKNKMKKKKKSKSKGTSGKADSADEQKPEAGCEAAVKPENMSIFAAKSESAEESKRSPHNELQQKQHDGVSVSELPIGRVPAGRWRLGVPCPYARAVLLRFANAEDLSSSRHNVMRRKTAFNPDDFILGKDGRLTYSKSSSGGPRERRIRRDERVMLARMAEVQQRGQLGGNVMLPRSWLPASQLPPNVERNYKDLDNPVVDPKDPWGELAMSWAKPSVKPSLDYHEMLVKYATEGAKRKRDLSSESESEESTSDGASVGRQHPLPARERVANRRFTRGHRRHLHFPQHRKRQAGELDDDASSGGEDDVVQWNVKSSLPRMKMYADAEEKKQKKYSRTDLPRHEWRGESGDGKSSIFSRLSPGRPPLTQRFERHPHTDRDFLGLRLHGRRNERPFKRQRREEEFQSRGLRSNGDTSAHQRLGKRF